MSFFTVFNFGLILTSAIALIVFYVRRQYNYWQSNGIPHPTIQFPYGNIKGALTTEHISDILNRFYQQFKGTGPFVGFFFLLRRTVLAVDIEFIKKVLVKDFQYFENRGFYYNERDEPLSGHLFNLDVPKWRKLRSKLTPTFTSGKMKYMFPNITKVAEHFREVLGKYVDETAEPLEIKELLGRFTVDVIGSTAFGIECKCLDDPTAQFLRMGQKIFKQPRHHPLFIFSVDAFPHIGRMLGIKGLPDDVTSFFMNIVRQTVEYREQNQIERNDFMDLLIKLKNPPKTQEGDDDPLTLNEISAQAFVFFLAGFETSSTTMTFALHELGSNLEIQARLRDEIEEVLQRHDGELTYEAMLDMPYLDQVINETLRKYPPVPAINRQTSKEYYVPEYDFTIPKDYQVWIPALSVHMDPEFYPNPSVFDPERFTAEEVRKRNPITFLPFGDGPRNCIGMRFGMMQVRIGLIMLLRNFQFKTTRPLVICKNEFILAPEGGMWLDVKRVN